MKKVILLSLSILLICLAYAFAEVPCKINYQGRLIKDNVPVDGTKKMVFSIYNDAVAVTPPLWTSGDVNVEVHNGLFRYVLDLSSIDWTAGQELYLEVKVGPDTLTPREELYAYPYAINSHLLEGKAKEYFLDTSGDAQTKQGNLNIMGNLGIGTPSPLIDLAIGDSDTGLQQQGDGELTIYTNNLERVRIDNIGNVGIGTTDPGAKLHIAGAAGTDGIMFPDGTLQTTAGGSQSVQVVGTTNIQVGSSWTDMTDMMINMNTTGGNVLLMFSGNIHASGNDNARAIIRFNVDGNSRHNMAAEAGDGGWQEAFAMHWLEISLPAGSHTFKVQWREDDATVYQDGVTYPRVFTVIELL